MTESLFDSIINTAQDCVFWKDKERRFIGVNQAFLDFYGFESADVLIGKTDEDMQWHNDPEPFKQDELRVLEGHSTYKVQGKCIIRGEERDIIASKRPIYEGDEIVGLVGSFVDVTDVLRRNGERERKHFAYTREKLIKYPFFDKLLNDVALDDILDPLTGLINRGYTMNYVRSLIMSATPFTFVILDLDNFKYINDTFGHHAGDIVLENISTTVSDYLKDHGIVGRFGGDELLVINLEDISNEDKERFMENMYFSGNVLRSSIYVDEHELYITGTAGCASFPDDASSYEELFSLADKMLYLGKSRGRNCYNIYSKKEHSDLDIKKLAKQGVYTNMSSLMALLEKVSGFENRLRAVMQQLQEEIHITDLYYCGKNRRLSSVIDRSIDEDVSDIDLIMDEDLYFSSTLDGLREKCPVTYNTMNDKGIGPILIARIGLNKETDGYLVCAEQNSQRIWQEDECGIIYFIAKGLAAYIRLSGDRIEEKR